MAAADRAAVGAAPEVRERDRPRAAAVPVGGFAGRRCEAEKHSRWRYVVIAAVIAGALHFATAVLPEIDLEQLLDDVSEMLGTWTYVLVGLLAFLETGAFVGLVAPGETFVILAGAVAGQGDDDIVLTIAIVWFCAWAGDTTSFFIGRRLGRGFILKHGPQAADHARALRAGRGLLRPATAARRS